MAIKLEDLKKVDFSQMLNTFYINNVILPLEKVEELKEKKNLNIRRLKEGLEEYNIENSTEYKIDEFVLQGSIAMGTAVSADEKNYDIDIGVIMDKSALPDGTLSAKKIISESLKKKCYNMKNNPDPNGNSITIEYEEGYHLDFALYGKKDKKYYHCGTTSWDERNPKAISWWFNNQNQKYNNRLQMMTKFLKFFCKQDNDWIMPGGLIISVLVDEAIKKEDLSLSYDVLLKDIVNSIVKRLRYDKSVYNPVDLSKNLIVKQKDVQKLENLQNRLENRITKVNNLTINSTSEEIYEAWNYFFGDEYFSDDFELKIIQCEDNEEYINTYFDILRDNNTNNLIKCQLSSKEGSTDGRTIRNYESNMPLSVSRYKDERLIFTAHPMISGQYTILWKIRNSGKKAVENNSLRGNIVYSNTANNFNYIDINGNTRYENISFPGHHYIDCYVIKDDYVIQSERFLVNLTE